MSFVARNRAYRYLSPTCAPRKSYTDPIYLLRLSRDNLSSSILEERIWAMKKSRFSEERIAYALRQADGGTPVGDVCRQLGVSEATFYIWKKKYGKLGLSEPREVRQLRDENARLKRLVADLTLDKHILSEVIKKKV
jgi:putative transposase